VTYGDQELLDLLQGVAHPGVGLGRRGEHLDEDVQVFVQVLVLGLGALPQLFFLMGEKKRTK